MSEKPLGRKNYGHIPHLPNSRMGPGDHKCHEGQARIATVKTRERYELRHEPFVVFDLMVEDERLPYDDFVSRVAMGEFVTPALIQRGGALSVEEALERLNEFGFHGAIDPVEGAVWRVEQDRPTGKRGEKKRVVDFLVKYVRPDKVDGLYLPELSGQAPVWNWYPNER
ncbi:MAG: hypothetical protein L0332_01205 [Chloroflexi bacterium]|nr:hypothetical protein [Chloroflexota bacterium]MCI0649168.1 hypothetical protein [Chloroflexota bacterium]MCI0725341.1 hypothetical protein [Chloroflexota bacterium]